MLKLGWRSLTGTAMIAVMTCAPVASTAETLRDALIGSYHHSGLMDQNRALLRAADEDVAQAVAALRPILSWTASATRTDVKTRSTLTGAVVNSDTTEVAAVISLSWLLWDNNRSKLSVDAAKESVLATRQQLISIEQQIFLRAVRAYFNVRREGENVALQQNNLRLITEELRAARDRFEVGEVTRTDVAQAEARLAQARGNLAASMGNLVQAQEEYTNVVGRKPGQLAPPGNLPRVERDIPKAKAIAVQNHPDLKQIQHLVAAAEINVDVARRAPYPTVTLDGSVRSANTTNTSSFSESISLGVTASGPIYRGGALASTARQAIASRDAQRGNLHTVRHNIRQNVGSSYAQFQSALALVQATQESVRASRVAFEGVREEATLGARTTLDVLNAEQSLLNAQVSAVSAQADSYIAAYTVLSSMGQLTASGLGLGIRQYDPTEYYNLAKTAPINRSKQGQQLDRVLKSLQKN